MSKEPLRSYAANSEWTKFLTSRVWVSIMPEGDIDPIPLEDSKILIRDMGSCLWFED